MFEVIKSEYGKELGIYELDYLGEHPELDMLIINAKIKLCENGLQIQTGLNSDSLFIEWQSIKGITCTRNKKSLINIITDKGIIKLLKEKKETNLSEFKKTLKSVIPNIKIKYIESDMDNVTSIEMKRAEKLYDEQERRVEKLIMSWEIEDDSEIEDAWCTHLEKNLQFPFEAEIIDEPGSFKLGDVLAVKAIEGVFDLYGIIVKVKMGRKQSSFPLCLLELMEKDTKNYQLVDDYIFWFYNR